MPAFDRPFARVAAEIHYGKVGLERLKQGLCPQCGEVPGGWRNDVERRETDLSGLCPQCQTAAFARFEDDDG
jgi:ribosomal protein S27AE